MRLIAAACILGLLVTPFACSDDDKNTNYFPTDRTGTKATGPFADTCIGLCEQYEALGCSLPADCPLQCVQSIELAPGNCEDVTRTWVECRAAGTVPSCGGWPSECDAAYAAWRACPIAGSCGPVVCSDFSEDGCSCSAECAGKVYEENCLSSGDNIHCECLVDGEREIDCASNDLSCAFFIGCCSVILPAPTGAGGGGGMGSGAGGVGGVGGSASGSGGSGGVAGAGGGGGGGMGGSGGN